MTRRSSTGESTTVGTITAVRTLSWLALSLVVGLAVIGLRYEGRRWWCRLGDLSPWSAGIRSPHTSQHLVDPYSLTHVLHGLLFYALLRLVAGRLRWDARLVVAVALECLWEVAENSAMVIERYRRGTVALGYEGDSILNSLGDVASCGLGLLLARRLPVRWSVALFLVVEVALLVLYRDNLLLNLIMLLHPSEAIKSWQSGR
jgi:Protein of unknown function (DUF2585)